MAARERGARHTGIRIDAVIAAIDAAPAHGVDLLADPMHLAVAASSAQMLDALVYAFSPYLLPGVRTTNGSVQQIVVAAGPAVAGHMRSIRRVIGQLSVGTATGGYVQADGVHIVHRRASRGPEPSECFLLWRQRHPSTTYVALSDSGPGGSLLLLRIARAIASRVLIEQAWLPVHAACLASRDGAVTLVGHRRAGKTTTLISLLTAGLESGPVGFVANDTVFLRQTPSGLLVRGLPTSVAIRWSSVGLFPQLRWLATQAPSLHPDNLPDGELHVGPDARVLVPPRHLAAALHVQLVPMTRLRGVIDVRYRGIQALSDWRRLHPTAARRLLERHYLNQWFPDQDYETARLQVPSGPLRLAHQRQLTLGSRTLAAAHFEPGSDATEVLRRNVVSFLH
jgi:hypothetical protein